MSKQNIFVILIVVALGLAWTIWPVDTVHMPGDNKPADTSDIAQPLIREITPEKQDLIDRVVPHKALYRMSLVEMSAGSPINEVEGDMYYKWEDVCDAWSTDHRFSIEYFYNDRPSIITTRHFVAWEGKSGDKMSFFTEGFTGAIEDESIRGRAQRLSDMSGVVFYTSPEGHKHSLPKGFYFPTDHTLASINAALEGKTFFNAIMFDGTDDEDINEINIYIDQNSAPLDLPEQTNENGPIDYSLLSGRSWNTRLAFYDIKEKETLTPSYEMRVRMHENGIVSDMIVEYDKFSVRQELIALSALPKPEC